MYLIYMGYCSVFLMITTTKGNKKMKTKTEKTEEVNTSGATPPISVSNVDNSQHLIKPDNSAKTMYRMFPMHHLSNLV